MFRTLIFLLVSLPFFKTSMIAQTNFVAPASEDLIKKITSLDSALFTASFDHCDLSLLDELLSEDLEFYHDKWGLVASSSDQFIQNIRSSCADQEAGNSPKAKRKLIKESVQIYPMKGFGALQMGKHDFYQFKNGKFEFTESALFTHLWEKTDKGWKLLRVMSYDHKPER